MFTDDIKFLQKAVVFHFKNKQKFLALKRPADAFSRPNDWDLIGGNVLYGELHDKSLRREIKEETNLEVDDCIPVQIITTYGPKNIITPNKYTDKIYTIFNGFYCQAISDKVEISEEHSEFRWITQTEFIALKPQNS